MANKWENLGITRAELNTIEDCLKKEEFRKLLIDYCEEINDPANKKIYQEEITQLEKERGNEVTFIEPKGGYVIKTSLNGSKLAFVNICSNDNVQKPVSEESIEKNGKIGSNWSVPHLISPPREDLNKKSKRCTVYDIIFHPEAILFASRNKHFRELLNNIACDAIESNFNVKLDKTNLKFPKMKFKGVPRPLVIRKKVGEVPSLNISDPVDKIYSDIYTQMDNSKISQPKTQKRSESPKTPKSIYTTPKYLIKHRTLVDLQDFTYEPTAHQNDATPKELIIEIDLPLLKTSSDLKLDVTEKTLTLTSEKPAKYNLYLTLPYKVSEETGSAKFDQDSKKLTITLPVLRKNLSFDNDSGVESDHVLSSCNSFEENSPLVTELSEGFDFTIGFDKGALNKNCDNFERKQCKNGDTSVKKSDNSAKDATVSQNKNEGVKNIQNGVHSENFVPESGNSDASVNEGVQKGVPSGNLVLEGQVDGFNKNGSVHPSENGASSKNGDMQNGTPSENGSLQNGASNKNLVSKNQNARISKNEGVNKGPNSVPGGVQNGALSENLVLENQNGAFSKNGVIQNGVHNKNEDIQSGALSEYLVSESENGVLSKNGDIQNGAPCENLVLGENRTKSETNGNESLSQNGASNFSKSDTRTSSNTFLDLELYYSLPEFSCHTFNDILIYTLHVKNVQNSSLDKIFPTENSVHIKFYSLSPSFVPIYYSILLKFPKNINCDEFVSEIWDNNLILQIPFLNEIPSKYYVGASEETLEEKIVEEPSNIFNQKINTQELSDEESEVKCEVVSTETNGVAILLSKTENQVSESVSSEILTPSEPQNHKKLSHSFSESSCDELSVSPTKGILKSRSRTLSRSVSESSVDDYTWSSFENFASVSGELIPEELEVSSSMKKTVRFNDVVSKQLFRTNSSILGQKKKNQRKSRNKKRAQERRLSESENSEAEDKVNKFLKKQNTNTNADKVQNITETENNEKTDENNCHHQKSNDLIFDIDM